MELRSYMEWLDHEANLGLAQLYQNSLKQQQTKISQTLTSMQTLVHIYYLKQI